VAAIAHSSVICQGELHMSYRGQISPWAGVSTMPRSLGIVINFQLFYLDLILQEVCCFP